MPFGFKNRGAVPEDGTSSENTISLSKRIRKPLKRLQKIRNTSKNALKGLLGLSVAGGGAGCAVTTETTSYSSRSNNRELPYVASASPVQMENRGRTFHSSANALGFNVLDNQALKVGVEEDGEVGTVVGVDYAIVGGNAGTLFTYKTGDGYKSGLVTGVFNGVNFSASATAGMMQKDVKGVPIGQGFIGAEIMKFFESGEIGMYANASETDTKTLSVSEITWTEVVGGRQHSQTTSKWMGGKSYSAGIGGTYVFNSTTKVEGNIGYDNGKYGGVKTHGINYGAKVSKILGKWELVGGVYGSENGTGGSQVFSAGVNRQIGKGTVGFTHTRTNGYQDENTTSGVTFSIPFGGSSNRTGQTYSPNGRSKLKPGGLRHVFGAENSLRYLKGFKKDTTKTGFVADEVIATPDESHEVNDDSFTVPFNSSPILLDVLGNDLAGTRGPISLDSTITGQSNGTFVVQGNNVLFTPNADFAGLSEANYSVTAGGETIHGSIDVNVELPTPSFTVTPNHSPIISGTGTNNMVATNAFSAPIVVNLGVNSPYTLSPSSLTFNPKTGGVTDNQTVDVFHNSVKVGTYTVTVEWRNTGTPE